MADRRILINLIVFVGVFVLMLVWAANNIITIDSLERPYEITGDFEQAAGVKANAEVTYLGVHYGRVSDVEQADGCEGPDGEQPCVRMTMKIDRGMVLPEDSVARVFRKSAIGEPYIDFVPPEGYSEDTPAMAAGDNVPLARTTVPLEFSELLRSASALISSVDPEEAGSLVHELALALDGRSEDLRSLTRAFDELTTTFAAKTEELDRLAENSTALTKVFSDHRLSLSRSLENVQAITQALREADGDTQRLLALGPEFLGTTADLVADQKRNLDCLLEDLTPVLTTLGSDESLEDLGTLLANGPTGFGYIYNSVDHEADGPWVRVNLLVTVEGENPAVYVPRKSLPVVPTISPCASTLTAATVPAGPSGAAGDAAAPAPGADAAPSTPSAQGETVDTAADGEDGGLADTGGVVLAAAAALLLAGGLLVWRVRTA